MDNETALLRALHQGHAPALHRFLRSLGVDDQSAQDLVQETLIRAWKHAHVLDQSERSARAWLFTVARNLATDRHRSAVNRREQPEWELPDQAVADASDQLLDRWLVTDALSTLAPGHREVIVRAYYRGSSVAQISDELGIAPGTVKSRMHYGLRALRLALQELGVTR